MSSAPASFGEEAAKKRVETAGTSLRTCASRRRQLEVDRQRHVVLRARVQLSFKYEG